MYYKGLKGQKFVKTKCQRGLDFVVFSNKTTNDDRSYFSFNKEWYEFCIKTQITTQPFVII